MTSFAELFPDGDYRFHLTLRRTEPAAFFAPQDATGAVVAERARWLARDPARYAALDPEGEPIVQEFARLAEGWSGPAAPYQLVRDAAAGTLLELGRTFEPDILFLSADGGGAIRLRGGALCFPTGWALTDKMGQPLEAIHGVVPGLNDALGPQIQQFLGRLKPGMAFLRDNWGIASTDELNLHPARRVPPPEPPAALDRLWLRVEHQALLALPQSRGIVFGIRIALHRLDEVVRGGGGGLLRRALETMPSQLLRYKRLDGIQPALLARL